MFPPYKFKHKYVQVIIIKNNYDYRKTIEYTYRGICFLSFAQKQTNYYRPRTFKYINTKIS